MLDLASIIRIVFAPTSVAWGFLIFICLVFFVAGWAVLAPGFPGIARGIHTVLGYYAGGNLFRMFRGNLVDCTHTWLNPYLVKAFREEVVRPELEAQLRAEVNPERRREIQDLLGRLGELDFTQNVRLLGLRTRSWRKHLFVVFFPNSEAQEHFPSGYVAHLPRAGLSLLSLDWLNKGQIIGQIHSFPRPWRVSGIGRVHVHVFMPYKTPKGNPSFTEQLPNLERIAYLSAFFQPTLKMRVEKKTLERRVAEAERKAQESQRQAAALATLVDTDNQIVAGFVPSGEPAKIWRELKGRRDLSGLGALMGVLFGGMLAQQLAFDIFLGCVGGAFAGLTVGLLAGRRG